MMMSSDLVLGYDYDKWYGYGLKQPIATDISTKTDSHTILCRMSGSLYSSFMDWNEGV